MAEHVGIETFLFSELTIHRRGAFAFFVRRVEDALGLLRAFFRLKNHDYTRFNYIGEWHSHPSFAPVPSATDDASMREIIADKEVGANFVVLLIVKLDYDGELCASAHSYLPDGSKLPARLQLSE